MVIVENLSIHFFFKKKERIFIEFIQMEMSPGQGVDQQ